MVMRTVNDLYLGTVKLGVAEYGFSSRQENILEPVDFLNDAGELGMKYFDTAPRYGNSEEILGQFIQQTKITPQIATKVEGLQPNDQNSPKKIEESVRNSLQRLKIKHLEICYLHQSDLNIISDPSIQAGLRQVKKLGLCRQIGVSVYDEPECRYAVESGMFDVVQLPVNVFDSSLYHQFVQPEKKGIRFIARSLLLQGLVGNRDQITTKIAESEPILNYIEQLDTLANQHNYSTVDMALMFVFNLERINQFIIGTTNIENLKHDISCLGKAFPKSLFEQLSNLSKSKKSWADPRVWTK